MLAQLQTIRDLDEDSCLQEYQRSGLTDREIQGIHTTYKSIQLSSYCLSKHISIAKADKFKFGNFSMSLQSRSHLW